MAAAESHEGSDKQTEEKQQSDTIAATVDKVEDNRSDLDILLEEEEETSLYDKLVQNVIEPIKYRPAVRNLFALVSLYFAATFAYSGFKVVRKVLSPRAKRKRQVNKNITVIEMLNEFLPSSRETLSKSTLEKIRYMTGFSYNLIFRKYLRYLLNERKFDAEAVSDILVLKSVCELTDDQTKEIMREIAQRTFKKYGILMMDTAGLSSDAITKKAAERLIFSKLLYLAELPEMVPSSNVQGGAQGGDNLTDNLAWQIKEIFGATGEDADALRIKTLSELDASDLENLVQPEKDEEDESE